MNINEVHRNFSGNGTKEPAKPDFETSVTFEPLGNFLCGFHLCAHENKLYHFIYVSLSTLVSLYAAFTQPRGVGDSTYW